MADKKVVYRDSKSGEFTTERYADVAQTTTQAPTLVRLSTGVLLSLIASLMALDLYPQPYLMVGQT